MGNDGGTASRRLEQARLDPEGLKGRMLAAARRAFARHGYRGTATRAIAADVGVDVSTLYYHWGSKRELFDAVLQALQLDFEEGLRAWIEASREAPLESCFELAVEHLGGFFLNHDVVRVVQFSFFDEDFAGRDWAVRSQRQLVATLRTFVERRFGLEDLDKEFDAAVLAFISSTLTLVGSRGHLAAILDVDPESRRYRDLVIGTLRRSVGAFLLALGEGADRALPTGPDR